MDTAIATFHRGGVEYGPAVPGEDVITAKGPDRLTVISDKVFDLRQCPHADQDEIITGVDGARVHVSRCLIFRRGALLAAVEAAAVEAADTAESVQAIVVFYAV